MNILEAIILGVVQGLTEFLPISSSGHLSIMQHFMGITGDTSLALSIFLHVGTLIAVIAVYYKTFWDMIKEMWYFVRDLFTGKLKTAEKTENRHLLYMFVLTCMPLWIILFPIPGTEMRIKDIADLLAGDNDIIVEGVALILTSVLLFVGTHLSKTKKDIRDRVEVKDALAVGFVQFFAAIIPGLSRSGSTISTGMICGVEKNYMVRYSFVLGTPAVIAATGLELKEVLELGNFEIDLLSVLVGIVVAAVVGFAAIKLLEMLVKTDKFRIFGFYCAIVGALVTVLGIAEHF